MEPLDLLDPVERVLRFADGEERLEDVLVLPDVGLDHDLQARRPPGVDRPEQLSQGALLEPVVAPQRVGEPCQLAAHVTSRHLAQRPPVHGQARHAQPAADTRVLEQELVSDFTGPHDVPPSCSRGSIAPASPPLASSPAASSPVPELGHVTAAGHTQLPLVQTQLVAIPPSTVVPSQAGLSDCRVYGHSSESPLQDPPGLTADAARTVADVVAGAEDTPSTTQPRRSLLHVRALPRSRSDREHSLHHHVVAGHRADVRVAPRLGRRERHLRRLARLGHGRVRERVLVAHVEVAGRLSELQPRGATLASVPGFTSTQLCGSVATVALFLSTRCTSAPAGTVKRRSCRTSSCWPRSRCCELDVLRTALGADRGPPQAGAAVCVGAAVADRRRWRNFLLVLAAGLR